MMVMSKTLAGIYAFVAYCLLGSRAFQPCRFSTAAKNLPFDNRLVLVLSSSTTPTLEDSAPSWDTLRDQILATQAGKRLQHEAEDRINGFGPPSADATIRLFGAKNESEISVTLYRDSAAWCPYCQKVWLLLEEKRIPYQVKKVPLNAYGDKPAWYTRKVDGGNLPAIEMDGKVYTESLDIMKMLDALFSAITHPMMIPTESSVRIERCLELEQELQSVWFSLVFYPVEEGEALDNAKKNFWNMLERINVELESTTGSWFLDGDTPTLVDIMFIPTIERMIASALYWKGARVRGKYRNLDRWLAAWEERPSYLASKSDYYTLIMAIPSQNGPGYSSKESKEVAAKIYGLDGAWDLTSQSKWSDIEHLAPLQWSGEEASRHEAAYNLIDNHANIVQCACRGAGEPGRPSYHAELADPYAEPNEEYFVPVDVCLRYVTNSLIHGNDLNEPSMAAAAEDLRGKGGSGELRESWEEYTDDGDGRRYFWNYETGDATWTPPTQQLDTCLMYLRDRIGVPRDMGQAAAMQLRAHLNWAIEILGRE